MLTFEGIKTANARTTYFDLRIDGKSVPLCYGTLYAAVGAAPVTQDNKHGHTWAWGYSGDDPGITAVTLLGCCIGMKCNFWRAEGLSPLAVLFHIEDIYRQHVPRYQLDYDAPYYCVGCGTWNRFMNDVVSKLPDRWVMTSDEIEQWIFRSELPACVSTNTQPKET